MSAALDPSFGPPARPAAAPPAADPRERLCALRPDLPREGTTFRAALVLLAAPGAGFNIDRVALRTGVPRHWVAACARRLRDNGVWSPAGERVSWAGPEDFRFWNDVGVAEGRLLRRDDARGRPQWAPAGAWAKAYDFVGPGGDPGGPVLYLSPGEPPPPPAAAPAPSAPPLRLVAGGRDAAPPPPARPAGPALLLPASRGGGGGPHPELFPGAAWLG